MFKVETHMHTSEISGCAASTASEMIRSCKERGYSAAFVTDHFLNGNNTVPAELPWKRKIELYCRGYENARVEGEKIGFKVFFGVEFTHLGADFLTYNLSPEWFAEHDELLELSAEEYLKLARTSGGFVIHAHPYREAFYLPAKIRVFPELVDGIEVHNAKNLPLDANDKALRLAKSNGLLMTAGSDAHRIDEIVSGCDFDKPVDSVEAFISQLREGAYSLIRKTQEGWG